MRKGQVTIYVVLGIVLVFLTVLLLFLRGTFVEVTPANVRLEIEPITGHVTECIELVSETPIDLIAKRGGYLNPTFFRNYNGEPVTYLCQNIPVSLGCMNSMLTLSEMETQLEEILDEELNSCLNVEQFSSVITGVKVTAGIPIVDVIIGNKNVEINVDFPVTVRKKDVEISENEFKEVVDKPLGDLYRVSQDILDYESQFGNFDQLIYMLSKQGDYFIYKKRPYPDKLYIVNDKERKLTFQFFVQGESVQ